MMTSSTLVETVSINYEDFNENFLTCGTCLCTYDGQEHTPKLLTCSHTVCRGCLERIAAGTGVRDAGSFRCPICRETIPLPRGGVVALPPSFLVNQLLDLMARQRKEVVPKCSVHSSQELLFCESCDAVFCAVCSGGTHGNNATAGSGEHTVIPFSIAIKRMSEILLYKAHLCINKLNRASEIINAEIQKLDQNVERTLDLVNHSFQEVITLLDKRRQELLEEVTTLRDRKKKILHDQLKIIETEKGNVQGQCDGLEYQVEVRNITNRIGDLNEKIDSVSNLMEPRENAFVKYEYTHNFAFQDIQKSLDNFGSVRSSKTFPPLCSASVGNCSAFIENCAVLRTIDYHGDLQKQGGDPVAIDIRHRDDGAGVNALVIDNEDGTYDIRYVPERPGQYELHVNIFERPIKNSPFMFSTSEHINPVLQFGGRGTGDSQFLQPVSVVVDQHRKVYVLDTGNSRIKVLSPRLEFLRHLTSPKALEGRGGIGLALCPTSHALMVVNWRHREVTQLTPNGEVVKQITDPVFQEPICVAVNNFGEVVVGDNGLNGLVVFNGALSTYRCLGWKGHHTGRFDLISGVAVGPNDELLVADSMIHVFGPSGNLLREIFPEGKGRGRYGGICVDTKGNLLATRCDKTKSYIQVFDFASGKLKFCIDSFDAKLKRPSGLAVLDDHHLLVVDLGNDCIKQFRYR